MYSLVYSKFPLSVAFWLDLVAMEALQVAQLQAPKLPIIREAWGLGRRVTPVYLWPYVVSPAFSVSSFPPQIRNSTLFPICFTSL